MECDWKGPACSSQGTRYTGNGIGYSTLLSFIEYPATRRRAPGPYHRLPAGWRSAVASRPPAVCTLFTPPRARLNSPRPRFTERMTLSQSTGAQMRCPPWREPLRGSVLRARTRGVRPLREAVGGAISHNLPRLEQRLLRPGERPVEARRRRNRQAHTLQGAHTGRA